MVPLPASRFGGPGGGAAAARGCNGQRSLGSPRPGRSQRGEAGMQDPARREEGEDSLPPTRACARAPYPSPSSQSQPGGQSGRAPPIRLHLRRSSAWSLFSLPGHEMLREDAEPRGRGPSTYLRLRFPLPEAGGIARVPAALAGLGGPGIRWLAAAAAELPARQLEGRGRRYLGRIPPSGPHPPGSRGLQSYSFPRCQRNFSSL